MRKGYRRRCKSLSRQSKMVQKRDGRAVVIARWELIGKTRLHTSVVDVIDLVGGVVFLCEVRQAPCIGFTAKQQQGRLSTCPSRIAMQYGIEDGIE
jgi:hypothetical protein